MKLRSSSRVWWWFIGGVSSEYAHKYLIHLDLDVWHIHAYHMHFAMIIAYYQYFWFIHKKNIKFWQLSRVTNINWLNLWGIWIICNVIESNLDVVGAFLPIYQTISQWWLHWIFLCWCEIDRIACYGCLWLECCINSTIRGFFVAIVKTCSV